MKALENTVEKLNKDLVKNAAATKKAGRAAATATGNVQRLGIAFRTTLAPITAIVGGITLMTKALNTVGGREANLAVIETGLRGLVDNATLAADELLNVADSLGKSTLFDEEDFTDIFKLFTSFRNIGVDSYERVAEAAADVATKMGTGPREAAQQLAKALEDPARQVTALARSGTVFTEQQKEQIKVLQESGDLLGAQEIVLKELEPSTEVLQKQPARLASRVHWIQQVKPGATSLRSLASRVRGAMAFLNGIADGLNFLTENFDVVGAAAQAFATSLFSRSWRCLKASKACCHRLRTSRRIPVHAGDHHQDHH